MGGPDGQDQGEAGGSETWAPNTGYCTRSGTEDWLCRPLSSPAAAAEEAARFGSGSGWGDNSVAAEREEEGGSAGRGGGSSVPPEGFEREQLGRWVAVVGKEGTEDG